MSVDFSDVQVGDRIKLTRENGDECTVTVTQVSPLHSFVETNRDAFNSHNWDTLEILERALPEAPTGYGAMVHSGSKGKTYFVLNSTGNWLDDSGYKHRERTVREFMRDGWKVVFEGLDYDA